MLDEATLQLLRPAWRTVSIDSIGTVRVRRPTLGEAARAATDRNWWAACVQAVDGSPLFPTSFQVDDLESGIALAILSEVNKPRPTVPPSGGYGESEARSSD